MKRNSMNNISDFLSVRDGKDFVEKFKRSFFVDEDIEEITKQQCRFSEAMGGASSELGEKTQTLDGAIPSRNSY